MSSLRTLLSAVVITVTTTAAHAAVYTQNFDAFVDGTTVLGDGSTISSNNGTNSVQSGALRMTQDGVGSTISSFRIPSLSGSAAGWIASFDFFLSDEAGANLPADGFSFNYGAIPALTNPGFFDGSGEGRGEEGFNALSGAFANLSFELDTWANGVGENGYNIAVQGAGVDTDVAALSTAILVDGGAINGMAVLSWDPGNGATMVIDTGGGPVPIFTNVATPGFTGLDSHSFAFSARTGGANETLTIDNIVITTLGVPEPATLLLLGLGLTALGIRRRQAH